MPKTNPPKFPRIGGHVSAAGGYHLAIERAEAIGAETIQIFGATPRGWSAPFPANEAVQKFKERAKNSSVKSVYLHAAYLPNLASPVPAVRSMSIGNLARHLEIAERIGAVGLIFHLGSGKESPKAEAIEQTIKGMREILAKVPGRSFLIMENSAGGGQKLGSFPDDLKALYRGADSPRVKLCFDTAHAFESGFLTDYTSQGIRQALLELDRAVELANLVAIHANDSKTEANSHHDKHENIGEGFIGLKGFKELAKDQRLWTKDWLLEVPGFKGEGPDKKNIDILRGCFR